MKQFKYWIPTALILLFIWGNSMLNGTISETISSFIKMLLTGENMDMIIATGSDHLLRKLAHFSEYMILAMCIYYGWKHTFNSIKMLYQLFVLFILVAPLDEFIQLFTDGRSGSIKDVLLDWCGYLTGVIIVLMYHKFRKH